MIDEKQIRQAALVVASLDRRSADLLLEAMPPAEAAATRRAVVALGSFDDAEQDDAIDAFLSRRPNRSHAAVNSGVELGGRLSQGWSDAPHSTDSPSAEPSDDAAPKQRSPFRFLHEARLEQLARFLAGEQPQTIAVVLAHVSPERAAELLSTLPNQTQVDVIRRLADLEQMDPEVLDDVEQGIESWLQSGVGSGRRAAGMQAVSQIIQASGGDEQRRLLGALAERFDAPAERPSNESDRRIDFRLVESLDAPRLARLASESEGETLLLALTGAAPALIDRIVAGLPTKQARALRKRLDEPGPLSLRDIDSAQQLLAQLADELGLLTTQQHTMNAPKQRAAA
jgi:flagellar motor switch protein FliG